MKVAVLVAAQDRPEHVERLSGWLARNMTYDYDLFVVESGGAPSGPTYGVSLSQSAAERSAQTLHHPDATLRGPCFAQNVALEHARAVGQIGIPYDFYWALAVDVALPEGVDVARSLIAAFQDAPRLALLAPTRADAPHRADSGADPGADPDARQRPGGGWRPTATCADACLMLRAEAVEEVGFLNPDFRYGLGAVHELSYHLHFAGWRVGYSDDVTYSRAERVSTHAAAALSDDRFEGDASERPAQRFAYAYFTRVYGPDWPQRFWAEVQPFGPERDTFALDARTWAQHFTFDELATLAASRPLYVATRRGRGVVDDGPTARPTPASCGAHAVPAARAEGTRVLISAAAEAREGWQNVALTASGHDHELGMLADGAADVIEAQQVLQYMTPAATRRTLRAWRRALAPGGELRIAAPDLERCVALIGAGPTGAVEDDDRGLSALFGDPKRVDLHGAARAHRWAWTAKTLADALADAGFVEVRELPLETARADHDMLLSARAGVARGASQGASSAGPLTATPGATDGEAAASVADWRDTMDRTRKAVFAAPPYDDAAALDRFFDAFARALCGRADAYLVLRVDPAAYPDAGQVFAALEASHDRALGKDTRLDVTVVGGPLSEADWRELDAACTCQIATEGGRHDVRLTLPTAPVARDVAALQRALAGGTTSAGGQPVAQPEAAPVSQTHAGAPDTGAASAAIAAMTKPAPPEADLALTLRDGVIVPPGITPDQALLKRIAALHPWFYPVEIDGLTVVPGVGTAYAPDWLANRAACRATMLVEEVLRRFDLRGKRVLDLACNLGFWSSFYAQAGAQSVLGVEADARHVAQGQLFWERGKFLGAGTHELLAGAADDPSVWSEISARGPFDVTLCAGLDPQSDRYVDALRRAADVTEEALIVDTRVRALDASEDDRTPDRAVLLAHLRSFGLEPEVLPVRFPSQPGVDGADSYADGARITVLARKAAVLRPLNGSLIGTNGAP
ncbi:MAG: hypothetical protein R3F49_03840 [Planctomycetota bacterium]